VTMRQITSTVIDHQPVIGGYFLLVLDAPEVAPLVQPGQFAHLAVPGLGPSALRRPLSIYKAEDGRLSFLYKPVGSGTRQLSRVRPGDTIDLIAPLGHGFPEPGTASTPVLVAGGYGMAALYLVAQRSPATGLVFAGGRRGEDILCESDFEALGWPVQVMTEDGSSGRRGRVTDGLEDWLRHRDPGPDPEFFVCGPHGLLNAVGEIAKAGGWKAWLSVDRAMGCGVGACLTCVQRIHAPDGGWTWARVCREGPVFECREIDFGEQK